MHPIVPIFFTILAVVLTIWVYFRIETERLLETVTRKRRGTDTERQLVLKLLQAGFPPNCMFHDLYLPTPSGNFSQIDLVLATEVGLIVFEVKRISGWIFGTASQANWTQVLAYGKRKYRLYNPILQNRTHITQLQKVLPAGLPMFSVVVLYGDATLRTEILPPQNTYLAFPHDVRKLIDTIRKGHPILFDPQNDLLQRTLRDAVLNGYDARIVSRHIESIEKWKARDRSK